MDKLFKRFCVFLSVLLVFLSVAMIFVIPKNGKYDKEFEFDLFDCKKLLASVENMELNLTSTIYVKGDGDNWVEYQRLHGDENRIWVNSEQIPQTLKDAFISIEDERFTTHKGVDWKRTIYAFGNLFFKYYSSNQGGSTITQQLVKNVSDDSDVSATRKIREIIRALYIESHLEKEQILEAYLNTIALGSNICGVQVAANYYFNKDVSQLTLAECASIAAITKHPVKYDPENNPDANKERRNVVLKKMYELKKITKEEFEAAQNSELVLDFSQQNNYEVEINNYFVDTLIDDVISDLSIKYQCSTDVASTMFYNGGYKIYSTLEPDIQNNIETVYQNVDKYFKQTAKDKETYGNHVQSAMTIVDYEGHILGLVGGIGEKTQNRGLNRATDSPRQPGSTMKPIGVYALAIENEIVNYSSMVPDEPIKNYYGSGKSGPKEWYGYYKGDITVQYALEKSANTIPVRLLQEVGIDKSYDFLTNSLKCKNLTEIDKNLASLALGGCQYGLTTTESAAAYAIFGNGGKYFEPTTYYTVERSNGEVVLECDKEGTQVISEETATIMNRLLQQVVYGGEGTGGSIAGYNGMKVYAKTGTSSESNDLWMVAGSPYYVGSVWYGFDKPEQISNQGAAATVWRAVMKPVHTGLKYKDFNYSENVYSAKYCTASGKIATGECGSTMIGYYKKGSPVGKCDHSSLTSAVTSEISEPVPSQTQSATVTSSQATVSSVSGSTVSSEPIQPVQSEPSAPVESSLPEVSSETETTSETQIQ